MQRKLIRAAVAVPVVVASAFWTTHLAAPGAPMAAPAAETEAAPTLPDGRLVPDRAIEVPASISASGNARTASVGRFSAVSARTAAGDIPAVALAAYQRAESLISSADKSCHLSWQLLAAVGRIESDHGRFDGAAVGANGVSRPSIIGPVLDGSGATSVVRDTDAGELDGDVDFDRAVGPLQFIPSTWAVVGVDGDADGARNPQDVDDASLAAAVYLCSGEEDLATDPGLRGAIFRYNHSTAYVDQVVTLMEGYLAGNDIVPLQTTVSAGLITPLVPLSQLPTGAGSSADAGRPGASQGLRAPQAAGIVFDEPRGQGAGVPLPQPTPPVVEPPPPVVPTEPTEPTGLPTESPAPTPLPTETPAPTPSPSPEPTPMPEPTEPTEPSDEAVEHCTAEGYVDDPEAVDDDYDACVTAYDDPAEGPAPTPEPGPAGTRPDETMALPVD